MRRVWLILGSLAFALVLGEVICRQIDPAPDGGRTFASWRVEGLVADPELAYSFQPGYSGRMTVEGEYDVPFAINAGGLRDDHEHPVLHPGRRRILLVGDSFVFGVGVPLEDTLGERLERSLGGGATPRATGARPVEVVAAGCPGYGLDDYALLVERWTPRVRPNLVVVAMFVGNDLLDYDIKRSDPPVVIEGHMVSRWQAWAYTLRKHSALAQRLLRQFNPHDDIVLGRPKRPRPEDITRLFDSMKPWIARLAAATGPSGPPVAVVPIYGRDNVLRLRAHGWQADVAPLQAVLSEMERAGIAVLDPRSAWMDDALPLDELYFPRDLHLNAEGNRFVSEWLTRRLRQDFRALFVY